MKKKDIACVDCYKIICRQCGWMADEKAEQEIQHGKLSACPTCGWKPGEDVKL